MPKLVRITTMPVSLLVLLKGQMKFMKDKGFDVTMISSEGPEVSLLVAQEECSHLPVKLTRKITPFTDLMSLIRMIRVLKKIKPDIVHTHTPKAGLIGMWAARFSGVPVRLHTIAGLPWMESRGLKRVMLKWVERLTAWAACKVYPNSNVQKEFLIKENIAKGKMEVLGKGSSNGIDTSSFSRTIEVVQQANVLRSKVQLDEKDWVWIFVGRIVKDKGIEELLDAFVTFQKRYPTDQLWIVGEEEVDLDPLSTKHHHLLHHQPGVHHWGYQQDIRPYLAGANVLAFPSYREGFPNVPLQAGAMGCTLLLSDINGCNEIVEHGKNGLLVPVKNSDLLLKQMQFLREHPEKLKLFSDAIRIKIEQNYDRQNMWNLLLKEYQELLK